MKKLECLRKKHDLPGIEASPRKGACPRHWRICLVIFSVVGLSLFACGSAEIKPVDIFPEDMCASCRMAISERLFASQIHTTSGEVYKFDDLGCLENFERRVGKQAVAAAFVMDYAGQRWLPLAQASIVQTGVRTPMGSGKVAFSDSLQAREFLQRFPPGG
ncbi:MAG: hypothetical protein DKINENOH_01301 [bacterium]|nr:hypothetical protein [bacterium]